MVGSVAHFSGLCWPFKAEPDPIQFYGNPSEGFKKQVREDWEDIPEAMRSVIVANGFKLCAGAVTTDIPAFQSFAIPRDPSGRTHPNEFGAGYNSNSNSAFVTEYFMLDGVWRVNREFVNAGSAVCHEAAHAYYIVAKGFSGKMISSSPAYVKRYADDVTRMGGILGAQRRGYGYYVRPYEWTSGRTELACDLTCALLGLNVEHPDILKDFRNTAEYMANATERIWTAREPQPAISKHLFQFRNPVVVRGM